MDRVVLAASADGGTFGQVRDLRLRLLDVVSGAALAEFAMTAGGETAFIGGELYRRADSWKFRAVGQGYASGLAGLATDFGIAVEDDPAPVPAPATRVPSQTPAGGPRLTKGEERLPADVRERLSLRKRQVAVSLEKRGAAGITARVVLARFDTLPGRMIDNVGFFAVDDIDEISDQELYDRLLAEFPRWLTAARTAGVLR